MEDIQCPVLFNGLSLRSDRNDNPMGENIYRCISRVKAKPFDRDFDEQVSASEQLYGPQLRLLSSSDQETMLGSGQKVEYHAAR